MDMRERRVDTARKLGSAAILIGIAITLVGLVTDGLPAQSYFFAGILVLLGLGLRLEAAITERRD